MFCVRWWNNSAEEEEEERKKNSNKRNEVAESEQPNSTLCCTCCANWLPLFFHSIENPEIQWRVSIHAVHQVCIAYPRTFAPKILAWLPRLLRFHCIPIKWLKFCNFKKYAHARWKCGREKISVEKECAAETEWNVLRMWMLVQIAHYHSLSIEWWRHRRRFCGIRQDFSRMFAPSKCHTCCQTHTHTHTREQSDGWWLLLSLQQHYIITSNGMLHLSLRT